MSGEAELFPQAGGASSEAGGSYQVLARRARPQNFADVIGQEHVTQTLVNALRTSRVAHAFVFSGMRGVGKTTTARILAKALNCEQGPTAEPCNRCRNCVEITEGRSLDVFEVDAASQTGIDAARELLETVKYQPAGAKHRIYIIDEAHGLSKQAVDAFLKTLEEPPPHVKFILATTAANKLPATVLSRCQRYDFRAVAADVVARALGAIATREGVEADQDALLAIARESGGSMRDATSLLDQVLAFSGGKLDASAIAESLGLPDRRALRELFAAIAVRDPARALDVLARVHAQGTDLSRLCADLLERLRDLSVLAVAGRGVLVDLQPAEIDELEEAGRGVDPADLQRWFRVVLDTLGDVARAPDPRLVVEMAVVRMASMEPLVGIADLVARLEAIEGGGAPPPGTRGGPGGGAPRSTSSLPPTTAAPLRAQPPGPVPRASAASPAPPRPAPVDADDAPAQARDGASAAMERPAPAPAGAPAGGASPATGIEFSASASDAERWQRLVEALQRERAAKFFRLSFSKLVSLDDEAARVAVTTREAVNALSEREVRAAIEDAIEQAFGRRVRFEPLVQGASDAGGAGGGALRPEPRTLDRQAREDPVVQLSVELLEGTVEAVVPRKRG